MSRKKYLFIVEKPYIKGKVEEIFQKIKNELPYDVDIGIVNNHILNTSLEYIKYDLNNIEYKPVCLKNRTIPNRFCFIQNELYQKFGEKILELVNSNSYDGIVNACDPDEEGEMMFQYTIESLHLENYQILNLSCYDLTQTTIEKAFHSLKEKNNEN